MAAGGLRQLQPLHHQGPRRRAVDRDAGKPAHRDRGRGRRRLLPSVRNDRIPRKPRLGDLPPAARGEVLGRDARHRAGRDVFLRTAARQGPVVLPGRVRPAGRGGRGAGRPQHPLHLHPRLPAPRPDPVGRRPAGVLARRFPGQRARAGRKLGQAVHRLRPLHVRKRRHGPQRPLRPQPRLLGRGPADQCRPQQFRPHPDRVFRRLRDRVRGVQGRRLHLPQRGEQHHLGDPLRLPRLHERPRREGRAAERQRGQRAGLGDEPAPAAVPGPARARGAGACVQLRMVQRDAVLWPLRAGTKLLGELAARGDGQALVQRARDP